MLWSTSGPFVASVGGNRLPEESTQLYPVLVAVDTMGIWYIAPFVGPGTAQTLAPAGMMYQSACKPTPSHTRWNSDALATHLPFLHLLLSHSSLDSQSSPSLFFETHLPSEHEPLWHSASESQLSPASFSSAHLPSLHEPASHSMPFVQAAPGAFLPLLQPGKSGGHSAPALSSHWTGAGSPGKPGGAPAI